jgi:hypothetical protein
MKAKFTPLLTIFIPWLMTNGEVPWQISGVVFPNRLERHQRCSPISLVGCLRRPGFPGEKKYITLWQPFLPIINRVVERKAKGK